MLTQRSAPSLQLTETEHGHQENKLPASPSQQTMEEAASPTKLKYDRWIAKWPQRGAGLCRLSCSECEYNFLYGPAVPQYEGHNTTSRAYHWGSAALKVTCFPVVACYKLDYATEYLGHPITSYPDRHYSSEDKCCNNPKQDIPEGCCLGLHFSIFCCDCFIARPIFYPIAGIISGIAYGAGACADVILSPSDSKTIEDRTIAEFRRALDDKNVPEAVRLFNENKVIRDYMTIKDHFDDHDILLAVSCQDVKAVTIHQRKQVLAYMWERALLFQWVSWFYNSNLIHAVFRETYTGSDELLDFVLQIRVSNRSLPCILVDSSLKDALTKIQNSLPCNSETYLEYKKKEKILNKYGISISWKAVESYEQRSTFLMGLFGPKPKPECQLSAVKDNPRFDRNAIKLVFAFAHGGGIADGDPDQERTLIDQTDEKEIQGDTVKPDKETHSSSVVFHGMHF